MSATIAAALKKIAVYILTDKKALKVVCGIILGILIIIVMPIVAILGIFTGSIEIDTDRLHEMISENQTVATEVWNDVESAMRDTGYHTLRIKEAEVLFVYALYDKVMEDDFADRLVGCFTSEQTDQQLINAVNSEFGTNIAVHEFSDIMESIRRSYIECGHYVDPTTKNNLDIVKWAVYAESAGWGYVWGTYGQVLDDSLFEYKQTQYPDEVGGKADFIASHWLGGRTADCVGLIKGYSWFEPASGKIIYATNGMPDIDANAMYHNATEKGTIDTIPEIPGLAVWHQGHIGIYIGGGEVIEAMGTHYGVVRTQLEGSNWTHWLKIPYITYIEGDLPLTPNERHIWDVLYAKIGNPYGVAGFMGNLYAESNLLPNNLQNSFEGRLGYTDESYTQAVDDGSYTGFATDSAGYGLAQWTVEDRKTPFLAFANAKGCSISDLDMQLDFLCQELDTKFPGVLAKLKTATSVREASNYVLFNFEAPADQSESVQAQRAINGSVYYSRYAESANGN